MKWFLSFAIVIFLLGNTVMAQVLPSLFISTSFETTDPNEEIELNNNMEREERNSFITRNRYVEIDMSVLKKTSLVLNLFENLSVTAVITKKDLRSAGRYSLAGAVPDIKYSSVYLVVDGEKVTGNINLGERLIHIRWMGAGVHSIAEVDWKRLPESHATSVSESKLMASATKTVFSTRSEDHISASSEGTYSADSTDDGSVIDVLVVYTQAASAGGDIRSEIQLAVDHMNSSLSNSNISLKMNLVHTEMVDYKETGNALTDLNRLGRSGDGYMDGVLSLRDHYGADLVALITESMNNWCGLGMTNDSTPDEDVAFHVTRRTCLTYGTFAHEVGHNLGMQHESYQDASGGAYSYSHGYVDTTNKFRTIMSYGTRCNELSISCPRIDYYSTPDTGVKYDGKAVGTNSDDRGNETDNRQTAINTKTSIARFRQSKSASDEDVSEGCFIATAAYGTYLSPKVTLLRKFRDRYLKTNPVGLALVNFYYKTSPPIAHMISKNQTLRIMTRGLLAPLIFAMEHFWIFCLLVMGLVIGLVSRKRIGRRVLKKSLLILLILVGGVIQEAKAQVAYPSLFYGEMVRNPAIIMEKEGNIIGYQRVSESGETKTNTTSGDANEKEDLTNNRTRGYVFYKAEAWAVDFSTILSDKEEIENDNTSSSSVNSGSNTYKSKTSQQVVSLATRPIERLNAGIRLENKTVENEDFDIKDIYTILGVGLSYRWEKSLFFGIGGNYTRSNEEGKVENNYIDYYVGAALTHELMENTIFHFEYSVLYSPEDGEKASGDDSANYHRKTQENYMVAEAIYNERFYGMYQVYKKTISALSTRSEESDEDTTIMSLGGGYRNELLFIELVRTVTEREKAATESDLTGTKITFGLKF